MKPIHTFIFIFAIFIVIFMSGCTSNSVYLSSSSIIKEFSPVSSRIYSNEEGYIKLKLENDQDFFVKHIYAYLYNIGNDWGVIDVWGEKTHKVDNSFWSFDVDASYYITKDFTIGDSNVILNGEVKINDIEKILKGELPDVSLDRVNVFIMRKDISIMINDVEKFLNLAYKNDYEKLADVNLKRVYKTADKLPPIYINYLYPPSDGVRGESIEVYWVVKPPNDLPKGKVISNNIKARVCYEGVNRLNDAIHFVSRSQFLYDSYKNMHKVVKTSHSGPVELSLEVNDPVIITDTNRIVNMVITVKNVGNGVVTSESCKEVMGIQNKDRDTSKINKFHIKIEGDIDFHCDVEDSDLYLMRDNTIKIPVFCEANIPKNIPREDRYLSVEVSYTYYQDVSTTLNVEGI